ncbi:hypothetical protein GGTG_10313 [Gaeumannomyces tritici R3-111a-1]|uniref:Symplekin/Pta1 N-terminal domain-containing protein n=1 Tax=Gaeumannomyces tritici (strain R3-111a-1) TaxID=644352 RepID=J3P9Y9_GAET3|nr:hypothetical protein GGTG_10313 [Gaeumannomyces tritici R3-111a-1]EJT73475.1 hypothetical protein GGTG_10313 [Gaeumannomyces tritici R3-111a-1]
MAAVKSSVAEQIRQLNDARKHVLLDPKVYSSIVQGVLPIIGPSSVLELRRWGSDFLAEAFATPSLPTRDKETLSLLVLETLRAMIENPKEDIYVLKSALQTAASIYPLVIRWIVNNSYDTPTWERLTAIKAKVLQLWNSESSIVRIACIKFAQRVVLAQAHPLNGELKQRDGLEISLAMVPPSHPVLDARNLEAEATGLLDRMLGVLQDNSSDALVVDATLNCLSILIRTRPSTSNRILSTVLSFNPLKLANSPMTPKSRVLVKSMEKTTRMLLVHLVKRDPLNQANQRIHQHIERLVRTRNEIFDEASRKRVLAEQNAAALGDAKRLRLVSGPAPSPLPQVTPLPPGPTTLAAIFTLTSSSGLQVFDVSAVSADLAARICVSTLARVDPSILGRAVGGIRDRLATLEAAAALQPAALNPDTAPLGVEEDDDDYEPDFFAAEDAEQILNKMDGPSRSNEKANLEATSLALGAYRLPPPPLLRQEDAANAGRGTVANILRITTKLEDTGVRRSRAGINRLAASSYDRESWITVVTRLATRASVALDGGADVVSGEGNSSLPLGERFREALYNYVLEDFRRRIDVAISWLSEEWYNDQLQQKLSRNAPRHYDKVAIRLVDGITPYLHAQDKILTRFLGEIPEVNPSILGRVKGMCRDPSLANLALTSLVYLVMMRPPAKEMALDAMQGIWTEYEEARPLAAKYLGRWRRDFVITNTAAVESQGSAPAVLAS